MPERQLGSTAPFVRSALGRLIPQKRRHTGHGSTSRLGQNPPRVPLPNRLNTSVASPESCQRFVTARKNLQREEGHVELSNEWCSCIFRICNACNVFAHVDCPDGRRPE